MPDLTKVYGNVKKSAKTKNKAPFVRNNSE